MPTVSDHDAPLGETSETLASANATQPTRNARPKRRDRNAVLFVVFALLAVYLTTMGGHSYSVDEETYLAGTRALFHAETVIVPNDDLKGILSLPKHKNGGTTTAAPMGTLLMGAPFFVVGKLLAVPFEVKDKEEIVRLAYFSANSFFTAITGGLLVLLCRQLGASRKSSVLLALAFGLGTWAWPHSQTGFSEPGTALMLTATLLASVCWWKKPSLKLAAIVGFLAAFTVLTRPSAGVFIPILLIAGLLGDNRGPLLDRTAFIERIKSAVAFGVGGIIPGLIFAVNAYLRFGSPTASGYPKLSYATPIYEGTFGLFLSSGKGLFWYAPVCIVVLFGLRQSFLANRRYALTMAAILVTHLAVYSRFEVWSGENSYGPRYLVPILPVIVALLAPVIDSGRQWVRGVKVAAVVGCLLPGLLGSLLYFNGSYFYNQTSVLANMQLTEPTTQQQYNAWNFQPRSSPLMLNIRALKKLADNTKKRITSDTERTDIAPIPDEYKERLYWYARTVDLDMWWAWWPAKDGPAAIYLLLLVPLSSLGASTWFFKSLRKPQNEPDDPANTDESESEAGANLA